MDERTRHQRSLALARANEVRIARAQVKRRLSSGQMTIVEALAEPCCATMQLFVLLQVQKGWGRRRAEALFSAVARAGSPVPKAELVKELSPRQLAALTAVLNGETQSCSTMSCTS
jgi:hypothetical protein